MYKQLLSEGQVGRLNIRNRVVMAPMSNHYSNSTGDFVDVCKDYYKERAKGGTGLIITEFCAVDPTGPAEPCQLRAYHDGHVTGLKRISSAVQNHGGRIFLQLHHAGRGTSEELIGQQPMAPSEIPARYDLGDQILEMEMPREMTKEDIKHIVGQFVNGAVIAKRAGFDGVEIHGAHGYLLWQFFSAASNKRTDEYGGSVENRARIAKEIIEGIKEACGPTYPISLRISGTDGFEDGMNVENSVAIAKYLKKSGLDMMNVSVGSDGDLRSIIAPAGYEEGFMVYVAEAIKKEVDIAVAVVGMIRDFDFANKVIAEGKTDFVVLGRPHVSDPYMVNKLATGRENEIRKCLTCLGCLDGQARLECSFNPTAGFEGEYQGFNKDGKGRKVVVVGGGPAGCEAARVMAIRGFEVTLFEQKNRLGGQVVLAGVPKDKHAMNNLENYYTSILKKLGVTVKLNTPATKENVSKESPYLIFLATGSEPIVPAIKGIDNDNVFTAEAILEGKVSISNSKVIVVGSGNTGIETAEYLIDQGNEIGMADMLPAIGQLAGASGTYVLQDLVKHGIQRYPNFMLNEIDGDTVVFKDLSSNELVRKTADYLVYSLGVKKNDRLLKDMSEICENTKVIGDAEVTGNIGTAIRSGFFASYFYEVDHVELV